MTNFANSVTRSEITNARFSNHMIQDSLIILDTFANLIISGLSDNGFMPFVKGIYVRATQTFICICLPVT